MGTTPGRRWAPGVYAGLAGLVVTAAAVRARPVLVAAKPLLGPALLGCLGDRRRQAAPFAAGLVLSTVGDTALLVRDERWFLAGLGAFGGAQACYLTGFLRLGRPAPGAVLGYGALWAAAAGLLGRRLGRVRVPVLGYAGLLCAMAASASGAGRVAAGGAALFVASDLLIGLRVAGVAVPAGEPLVLGTYTAAQAMIIAAARRSQGRSIGPPRWAHP